LQSGGADNIYDFNDRENDFLNNSSGDENDDDEVYEMNKEEAFRLYLER
jgi:hypothetical protein